MPTTDKARYFTFLAYPENISEEELIETLRKSHGSFAISPVHEPDEEHSKPHWHVIYMHGNSTTLNGAKAAIPDGIAANGYIEPVTSPTNMQRYLIHLDDQGKQQFPDGINSIKTVNGFPLDLTRDMTKAEKAEIRKDLIGFIRENNVTEYSEFVFALMDEGDPDKLDYACTHTILFQGIIGSQRHSGQR